MGRELIVTCERGDAKKLFTNVAAVPELNRRTHTVGIETVCK